MSREEAEKEAKRIIGAEGWPGSARKLAEKVGCSPTLASQLAAAQPYVQRKTRTPRVEGQDAASWAAATDDGGLEDLAFAESWEALLKGSDPEERERIRAMPIEAQRELLDAWEEQRADAREATRDKGTVRRARP